MAEIDNTGFIEAISKPQLMAGVDDPLKPTSETMLRFNGVRREFEKVSGYITLLVWMVVFLMICSLVSFGMLFYERAQHARDWEHRDGGFINQFSEQACDIRDLDAANRTLQLRIDRLEKDRGIHFTPPPAADVMTPKQDLSGPRPDMAEGVYSEP